MSATKAEERKALEKIRNIVNELGEDSYIGAAFKGCFDIAEQNIDNDWMGSLSDSLKRLEDENRELKNKNGELKNKNAGLEYKYEICENRLDHFKTSYCDTEKMYQESCEAKAILETKAKELEQENIKLKARLYDLMIAKEEEKNA